jgi:hypothetical protein
MSLETDHLASASYRGMGNQPATEDDAPWDEVRDYHNERAKNGPPEDQAHHARLASEADRIHRRTSAAKEAFASGNGALGVSHMLGNLVNGGY